MLFWLHGKRSPLISNVRWHWAPAAVSTLTKPVLTRWKITFYIQTAFKNVQLNYCVNYMNLLFLHAWKQKQTCCFAHLLASGLALWQILNNSLHVYRGLIGLSNQLCLLQHRKSLRGFDLSQVLVRNNLLHHRITRLNHNPHDAARGETCWGFSSSVCGLLSGPITDQRGLLRFGSFGLDRTSIHILHNHIPQLPLPRVVVLSALVNLNVTPQMCLKRKCKNVRVG